MVNIREWRDVSAGVCLMLARDLAKPAGIAQEV